MREVLSQSEIDELLKAMTSGMLDFQQTEQTGTAAKLPTARKYDFLRPNKFSRDHLRTLEMLHQHYARLLSSFLSSYLRTSVNIEVASVAQMIYDEFIRSVPSPTLLAVLELAPLEGSALVEINNSVTFSVIDLLFGGYGASFEQLRDLTDIEISVMRNLIGKLLVQYEVVWKDIFAITPRVQNIETNPRFLQLYSDNEVVALITMVIKINDDDRGMINLCLPHVVLDPVLSRLSVRQQMLGKAAAAKEQDRKLLHYWLEQVEVDVRVELGEAEITVLDFLQLQEGDVLVLEQKVEEELKLYVEDVLKFGVQPGTLDDHLAIQVVSLRQGVKESGGQ